MSRKKIDYLNGIKNILGEDVLEIGNVVVCPKRAKIVLEKIYQDAIHREGFFRYVHADAYAPQRTCIPAGVERGDERHRVWLFFGAMTDRRGQSNRIYDGHERLWKKYPELYTYDVTAIPIDRVIQLVASERLGLHNNVIRNWVDNAKTLFYILGGEPLNIYKGRSVNDIEYPINRKNDYMHLPGFGPKILSLLSMFYAELDLMELPLDAFPVDVHVQRIAISTGILDSRDRYISNETAEMILRFLICRIAIDNDWSRIELSNALWLLGNQGCHDCYRCKTMSYFCPVYNECRGAISSGPYYKGKWDLHEMMRKSLGPGIKGVFSADTPLMQLLNDSSWK